MTSQFIVDEWSVNGSVLTLRFRGGEYSFSEQVRFPIEIQTTDVVSRLIDLLAIVAGVSYAKAVAPAEVQFPHLDVSPAGHTLVRATFNEGMREFCFHNSLPLTSTFHIADDARGNNYQVTERTPDSISPLIPFGAGRDSCVVASALRELQPTLFTIGINPYAQRIADKLSLPLFTASRTIDPSLLQLNAAGAPNGHVPVTAINSLISIIAAELTGHSSVVMANEKSASQPTRVIDGVEINHQYSKSLEFEQSLRTAVNMTGSSIEYFSVLREVHDNDISRTFATKCTELHPLFMSCNQAMLRDEQRRSIGWCCECPKCRGMFLSLAPFMAPDSMTSIFGRDLLSDEEQLSGFLDLLSDETKPFECVASVSEAKSSMLELLENPAWSQHVVVRGSRDAASIVATRETRHETSRTLNSIEHLVETFVTEPA